MRRLRPVVALKDCKGSKGRACFQRYMPEMEKDTGDKHKLSTKAWTKPLLVITTQPGEKNKPVLLVRVYCAALK